MKLSLDELTRAVESDGPELSDAWEAAAILESWGYNDRQVGRDFGFENTYSAGKYVYDQLRERPNTRLLREDQRQLDGIRQFAAKFLSSFIYSMPWIIVLFFEWTKPRALEIAPELGGPISLALMGSLITSGGFIQVIARRGRFYLGLKEPILARRICLVFLQTGFLTSVAFCLFALFLGSYFNLFSTAGLLVAGGCYVLLSLLWMTCAMLSTLGSSGRIPVVFLVGGAVFSTVRGVLERGTLTAETAALVAMLAAAALLALHGFRAEAGPKSARNEEMELPRVPVLIHSLAPYFIYGAAYFSFLFADRIAAGTAVSWFSGLSFGIESGYSRGMDLALLNFLFMAALVEALNHRYMEGWYRQAESPSRDSADLARFLRKCHTLYAATIAVFFVAFSAVTHFVLTRVPAFPATTITVTITWLGSFGYFLVALGLFNGLILFSLNRPKSVLPCILQGLAGDFLTSYTLSHVFAAHYAVAGLLVGGSIFAVSSTRALERALAAPDYAYYAA